MPGIKIYISYALNDRVTVKRLVDMLTAEGFSVYWDLEIRAGESFDEMIEALLKKVQCVVVVWSRHAVQSRWVRAESAWAKDRGKLVSIQIDDDLALPLQLYNVYTLRMTGWEGARDDPSFRQLVMSIQQIMGVPSSLPLPPPQAMPKSTVLAKRKLVRAFRSVWGAFLGSKNQSLPGEVRTTQRQTHDRIPLEPVELEKMETKRINELKVLIVGDGGSGKTSLRNILLQRPFNDAEKQTQGIDIDKKIIQEEGMTVRLNLWDFGGQVILHSAHQFFLSERSFYILVLDGRKEEDTEYWLKLIEAFGGSSPVLVVLNKIDEHPAFDVNRRFLIEKYPAIRGFFRISCRTSEGILSFMAGMRQQIASSSI